MTDNIKQVISSEHAPSAVGTYSQAIKIENMVYLSGQLPLHPKTMELISSDIEAQMSQVLQNLTAVAEAAGGNLGNIVRLGIYLTDLNQFPIVNEVMAKYFTKPYPARTTIGVNALPKGATIEIDAIMVLSA